VQRQYSGTLGKIGNCQIAVTAALWTGVRAWLVGAELYLPQGWLTRERRISFSCNPPAGCGSLRTNLCAGSGRLSWWLAHFPAVEHSWQSRRARSTVAGSTRRNS